jgi:hypothetical protein
MNRQLSQRICCSGALSAPHYSSDGHSFTGTLMNLLPRSVNRHGWCTDRVMPIRGSASTSTIAFES